MADTNNAVDFSNERVTLGDNAPRIATPALVVGALFIVLSLALGIRGKATFATFLRAYLVNYCFFLSLSLGAMFFVLIQHLTRAGWSVTVRRIAENFLATLPLMGVLALPIVVPMLLGVSAIHDLYEWTNAVLVRHDPVLSGKAVYLNVPFFTIRMIAYFALWCWIGHYFYKSSVAQDQSGSAEATARMQRLSAPAMIVFAFTLTFAAFDLIMSLDPHWFSTIFGVYYYAGSTLGFFCVLAIAMYLLQGAGLLSRTITTEHYHDVGKLAFAFTVFWAYIAYSQYMLIWYASIPEEVPWFDVRQQQPWVAISLVLLFGHFMIPFVALISRVPKRRPTALILGAIWLLLMHWFDLFWLVFPRAAHGEASESNIVAQGLATGEIVQCVLSLIGIGGLFVGVVILRMRGAALVPQRDPRLDESLAFENF